MNRRTLLTTAAAAALSIPAVVATTEPPAPAELATVHGALRWASATQWIALDDAGHTPTGIASIDVLADRVRVHYTFTAAKVASVQATPDESFAAAGVRVGASVGLTYTDLYFYMGTSQSPVNPALLTRAYANVWLTGWFHLPAEVTP